MKNTNVKEKQFDLPPVDEDGKPTTYLSFMILKLMFSESRRKFTPTDLARRLAAKEDNIDSICYQLKCYDLLTEDPSQPGKYQYNLDSANVELQVGIEKFLAYVELKHIPVYRYLDFSPSCRKPSV